MELENPENSPAEVVSAIDQPPPQVATRLRAVTARRLQKDAGQNRWAHHLCCESNRVCHQLASVSEARSLKNRPEDCKPSTVTTFFFPFTDSISSDR